MMPRPSTVHVSLAMTVAMTLGVGTALATNPQMGGPMKHVMVELVGNQFMVSVDLSVPTPELLRYSDTYTGPAAILNGVGYNSQYGWVIEGFWGLPPGGLLWIEQTSATLGLKVYSQDAFQPVLGTAGSPARFTWDGRMLHNWYASPTAGPAGTHAATYRVYFGNATGAALPGYIAGEVTLEWTTAATACPGDFTADGFVDDADFVIFAAAYEAFSLPPADASADLTGDGFVDDSDFVLFAAAYERFACP